MLIYKKNIEKYTRNTYNISVDGMAYLKFSNVGFTYCFSPVNIIPIHHILLQLRCCSLSAHGSKYCSPDKEREAHNSFSWPVSSGVVKFNIKCCYCLSGSIEGSPWVHVCYFTASLNSHTVSSTWFKTRYRAVFSRLRNTKTNIDFVCVFVACRS